MRSFDDAFRAALGTLAEAEVVEHLEDVARTLASTDRPLAESISSTHVVEPGAVSSLQEAASRIARRYGLVVTFEERASIRIRFMR